jgi:TolA-binding protein
VALAPSPSQGSDDPSLQRSESPGEALYDLAQEFRAKGQQDAYKETLRFIIERYPSSRRAVTARSELDALK